MSRISPAGPLGLALWLPLILLPAQHPQAAGQGTAISGPDFANMDHPDVGPEPHWFGHPFRVPENRASGVLRLGQWHATGTLRFAAIQLHLCLAVYLEEDGLLLRERLESAALPEGERARLGSLLEVPGSITAGMTAFTTDPGPIHARRAEIARAIERLGR